MSISIKPHRQDLFDKEETDYLYPLSVFHQKRLMHIFGGKHTTKGKLQEWFEPSFVDQGTYITDLVCETKGGFQIKVYELIERRIKSTLFYLFFFHALFSSHHYPWGPYPIRVPYALALKKLASDALLFGGL